MKYFLLLLGIFIHVIYANEIQSKQTINIGIVSFRDLDDNQKAWQPLEDYLNNYNQTYRYKIHSYTQDSMEKAVEKNELDIIISHPLDAVTMETKYFTHNIASIVRKDTDGHLLTHYGSVIVVKSNRNDINSLKDIKNKKIAVSHKDGFAAYLIAYDILKENGIDMEKDCRVVVTGQPMNKVFDALNRGNADVGVFRTGYLEELIAKGKLKQSDIKVINPQKENDFHYMLSSKLYPEWAVIATNNTSKEEIKIVTLALYSIQDSNCSEYDSFSIPSSYATTRAMMQKYYIYPFDKVEFSFSSFVKEYFIEISLFMSVILLFSWYFVYYYIQTSRKSRDDAKKLSTILTMASDGIHVHDKDGKFLFFSDSFHNMLGYTREEMSKLSIFDLERKISPEKIVDTINDIVANNKIVRLEAQHKKKDGTLIEVDVIVNAINLNQQDYLYAVSRDITEIKQQTKLLELQKEEFETIFETSQDGIALIDFDSNFLKVNKAYSKITGLSKEELLKTSALELSQEEDREEIKRIYLEVQQKGYVSDFEKVYFINGKRITVSISLSLMPDRKHILADVKNISVNKLFEAQSKLAIMGEMIGNITHQWRQPLSVISTIASGIQFREELGQMKEYNTSNDMETIMVQINYLSHTIEDFRDFMRGDLSIKEVYIQRVVEKTLLIVGATMKKNDITLVVTNTDDFTFVGYENEIVQAFINIINNAKDALLEHLSSEEERYIFINVLANEKSIEFLDNGGGIPVDVLPKIFESYFTTKHKDIGTGIGLSMTYQIITEHHNGKIQASNKEYEYNEKQCQGASFKITFDNL